jgi:heme/copper-type cytochrome/quinol oxidase subunit 4
MSRGRYVAGVVVMVLLTALAVAAVIALAVGASRA